MASKKLKKAIVAGVLGVAGAKALKQAGEMKTYLAEEGGSKAKINYITKKKKPENFMGKVKKAVNVYKKKGLDTPPGPNIKATDSLAGNYDGITDYMSKGGVTMVKARGGKLVNLKPTKMS